jgi:hypothetical protein
MKLTIALRLECPACGAELWVHDVRKFDTLAELTERIEHLGRCPNSGIRRMVAARRQGAEQLILEDV